MSAEFSDTESQQPGDPWTVVGSGRSKRILRDAELVLRAQNIPFVIEPSGERWILGVPHEFASRAHAELVDFTREEDERVVVPELKLQAGAFWWQATVLYLATLIIAHLFATHHAFERDWYSVGAAHAASIRSGEAWRTITALYLHTGVPHLSSNLLYGTLFGGLVAYARGGGIAFAAMLLAGALGNTINAFAQDPSHLSVGASTAVFGAVGLLCGTELRRRTYLKVTGMRRYGPLFLALIIFSWLGIGESPEVDRIDVFAHAFGVITGILLGVGLASLPERWIGDRRVQLIAGSSALSVAIGAWAVAFS